MYVTDTLPLLVVSAIGIDALFKSGRRALVVAGVAVLIIALAYDVTVLNNDIGYYNASMYTLHAFVAYVRAHPNGTYYANFLFSSQTNLVSAFRYNIKNLGNCSAAYLDGLPRGTYIATGGTISLDISPQYTQNFDACVLSNMTGYTLVDTIDNPLGSYPNMYGPQLDIYAK